MHSRRDFLMHSMGLLGIACASSVDAKKEHSSGWYEDNVINSCTASLPTTQRVKDALAALWQDIDPSLYWDVHAHLIGLGDSGSGIYHTPDMDSIFHPVEKMRKWFYLNAACAKQGSEITVDQQVVNRLYQLMSAFPRGAKSLLFAFDASYDEHRVKQQDKTAFHIPNDYSSAIAKKYADRFEWAASVHPYREDALEALQKAIDSGAKAVKWLPAAMGIDPEHSYCHKFYELLAKHHIPLISHAGEERAVHGMDRQSYGNPLKLRAALERGVKVIVAHCASIGSDLDLDAGKSAREVPSFHLFLRLMADKNYEKLLFGDISAVTSVNRPPEVLQTLLDRQALHPRLLNGSDYPLPAIPVFFSIKKWVKAGFLQEKDIEVLQAVRRANPLLFDLMMKRKLRYQGKGFSPTIFQTKVHFMGQG